MTENYVDTELESQLGRKDDLELISTICDRALDNNLHLAAVTDKLSLLMDIDGANEVCSMDLEVFLNFPDGDFMHDVLGIRHNFNRITGEMDNLFCPRCTR